MVSLLHGYIIGSNCSLCEGIRVIIICKAIVTQVMAKSCHQHTEAIKTVQLQLILEPCCGKKECTHLHDICSMKIIMILNIYMILLLDCFYEVNHLLLIK